MGMVFEKVKDMLPVSGDDYDGQIIAQINAAVLDLTRTAEIVLPGEVNITRTHQAATTSEPEKWVINLLKAYEAIKGSMRLSKEYTTYGEATV